MPKNNFDKVSALLGKIDKVMAGLDAIIAKASHDGTINTTASAALVNGLRRANGLIGQVEKMTDANAGTYTAEQLDAVVSKMKVYSGRYERYGQLVAQDLELSRPGIDEKRSK